MNAAHEPRAIKHVTQQRTVRPQQHRVACASNLRRGRDFINKAGRRHFVRHRDERASDVRELEYRAQSGFVVFRFHTHRHHNRVDACLLKVGVVDHRRFEGVGGVTDVGDECGCAADHGTLLC